MNTNGLQRHYHKLTARERFTALMAAEARNDEREIDALLTTAPRVYRSFPHTYGLSEAWDVMALCYMVDQLSLLADIQSAEALAETESDTESKDATDSGARTDERAGTVSHALLYVLTARAQAWRQVCGGYGVDPGHILKGLPGADSLALWERIASEIAMTEEEAVEYIATIADKPEAEVVTVESLAASLREGVDRLAAK